MLSDLSENRTLVASCDVCEFKRPVCHSFTSDYHLKYAHLSQASSQPIDFPFWCLVLIFFGIYLHRLAKNSKQTRCFALLCFHRYKNTHSQNPLKCNEMQLKCRYLEGSEMKGRIVRLKFHFQFPVRSLGTEMTTSE